MAEKTTRLEVRLDAGDIDNMARLRTGLQKSDSDIVRLAIGYLVEKKVADGEIPPKAVDKYDVVYDGLRDLLALGKPGKKKASNEVVR